MNITQHIEKFLRKNHRGKPYSKIYKTVLIGGKPYSMNKQEGYEESEYLPSTIRECVIQYTNTKDNVIVLFKDFVQFLSDNGVAVPEIQFPPVPVSNTFERLIFIAKYLQRESSRISDLPDILWVSDRQIEADLSRLRGLVDPIQVCGKTFSIPDTKRQNGRITFQSTAHPIFLAENLTQILVMLKGLKTMSENPLYRSYAEASAREIWDQLSDYAKERLRFVLGELLPEDYEWYEALSEDREDYHFHTESKISQIHNEGTGVLLECIKNEKPFCIEYQGDDRVHLYKDCIMEKGSYSPSRQGITVNCPEGKKFIQFDRVLRSAYSVEELASN